MKFFFAIFAAMFFLIAVIIRKAASVGQLDKMTREMVNEIPLRQAKEIIRRSILSSSDWRFVDRSGRVLHSDTSDWETENLAQVFFEPADLEIDCNKKFVNPFGRLPKNVSVIGAEGSGDTYALVVESNQTKNVWEFDDGGNSSEQMKFESLLHYIIYLHVFYNELDLKLLINSGNQ